MGELMTDFLPAFIYPVNHVPASMCGEALGSGLIDPRTIVHPGDV